MSSRGVTQPLTESKHFRRNRGRLVVVSLADEELTGRVLGVTDAGVELRIGSDARVVALSDIAKAVVQIEMNRPLSAPDEDNEEA